MDKREEWLSVARTFYKKLREKFGEADQRTLLALALAWAHYAVFGERGGGFPVPRTQVAIHATAELKGMGPMSVTMVDIRHLAREVLGDNNFLRRKSQRPQTINWEARKEEIWRKYRHVVEEG